jgi:hypothetical protein
LRLVFTDQYVRVGQLDQIGVQQFGQSPAVIARH